MKQLIKKILKESIKEKLQKRLEEDGLMDTLKILGLEIDEFSKMVDISVKELVQKYNPFEDFFTDEEFKNSLIDSLEWVSKRSDSLMATRLRNDSIDEIIEFMIDMTIDDFHSKLTNFITEDWKIPNTPELLYLRYGDWIKNNQEFKKFYAPYKK